MIDKYVHHDKEVFVQHRLKGQHRAHCLCWQGCKHFKPDTEFNCEIAQAVYENCVKFGIVSPVWECPIYKS